MRDRLRRSHRWIIDHRFHRDGCVGRTSGLGERSHRVDRHRLLGHFGWPGGNGEHQLEHDHSVGNREYRGKHDGRMRHAVHLPHLHGALDGRRWLPT